MEEKKVSKFKKKLEKEEKELKKKVKELEKMEDFGSDADDAEETSEVEQFGNRLSVVQSLKNRLSSIYSALMKIGKKQYGVCENCGKPISEDVLKINPESKLCKDCKKLAR